MDKEESYFLIGSTQFKTLWGIRVNVSTNLVVFALFSQPQKFRKKRVVMAYHEAHFWSKNALHPCCTDAPYAQELPGEGEPKSFWCLKMCSNFFLTPAEVRWLAALYCGLLSTCPKRGSLQCGYFKLQVSEQCGRKPEHPGSQFKYTPEHNIHVLRLTYSRRMWIFLLCTWCNPYKFNICYHMKTMW